MGNPDGQALFFFHGTPGSRLTLADHDPIVQSLGVRIVLPDRPGYGFSDPQPTRALTDWPHDVMQLADHLGIETFAVAGESGGGPHAIACAHSCSERVTKVLLLGSPAPAGIRGATRGMSFGNRIGFTLSRFVPWLVAWMIRQGASAFNKDPEAYLDALAMQMADPDKELLQQASFREAILRDFREAYRQGSEGHVVDGKLASTSQHWGFNLNSVRTPVFLWHGEDDTLVTQQMAEYLSTQLPNSTLYVVANAGHLLTERSDVIKQMRAALNGKTPESFRDQSA